MSELGESDGAQVNAPDDGHNEELGRHVAPPTNLVTLDVLATHCEFPLLAKLHVPDSIAAEYEQEWNAEQLRSTRLQLLGFKTFQRIVLSVRTKTSRASQDVTRAKCGLFTLSSSAKIAVKVAPMDSNKVYRTTRELVRDFPRYVRVLQDVQYRPDFTIKTGEVLELLRIEKRCVKVRGLIDILVCRHFYREVQFPIDMTTWLCCSPLVDDTVYMLSDLVRRFPLPRNIIVQNPHLLKITSTARKAFCEQQQVAVEFIIHELATYTFAVGMSDESSASSTSSTSKLPCVIYIQAAGSASKSRESAAFDRLRPETDDTQTPTSSSPPPQPAVQVQVLPCPAPEPVVNIDEIADYPYLDCLRCCALQVCPLDDALDMAPQQAYGGAVQQYSFASYAIRKSVALHEFSGSATPGTTPGGTAYAQSIRAVRTSIAARPDSRQQAAAGCFCPSQSDSCSTTCAASQAARGQLQRNELNGYIVEPQGATARSKQSSAGSFGNMIKKRVVRLFASSKHNVNITVTTTAGRDVHTQAQQRAQAKTGSAPNLHHVGCVKSSQNTRTIVEIPTPGASISTIISTPTRLKRSPKTVRQPSTNARGELRSSSVSLHTVNGAKRRTDSLSSLPQNRYNLVDLDIEIPDEMLAAQFGNSCALSGPASSRDEVAITKPISMTFSSSQLQSLGSTPGTTPTSTAVWYPNGGLPHQLSLYNLQMQPQVAIEKMTPQRSQFEFPPTPKQSMSNGTNSLSSGNEEASCRTKQKSSMSLSSISSVHIDDMTVQQLCDYLRRHNLERISQLCEQHCVDGPFFLDLTDEDLNGYPFCASPFETKCIKRLQKGILPKCD